MSKLATRIVIEINDCQEIEDEFSDEIRNKTFEEVSEVVKESLLDEFKDAGVTSENSKIEVYRFEILD